MDPQGLTARHLPWVLGFASYWGAGRGAEMGHFLGQLAGFGRSPMPNGCRACSAVVAGGRKEKVVGFFFTIYCSQRSEDGAGTLLRLWPSHVPLLHGVQCLGSEQNWEEKRLLGVICGPCMNIPVLFPFASPWRSSS